MTWKYFSPVFNYENFEINIDNYSGWVGHKFFIYDLIRNLKPQKIVELGTHWGTSFYSMCQAVKDENYSGKIYAVDTWQGDKHSGFYDDSIYSTVRLVINRYYRSISTSLIKKTFDEALGYFEDSSIDLLHIDGLHTFDAVKHDFENWLPKVKSNGIIILHDTHETKGDFGVYRLWDELKNKYQTLDFFHSHGLGIIFLSQKNPFEIDLNTTWQHYYSNIFNINILQQQTEKQNTEISSLKNAIDAQNKTLNQIYNSRYFKLYKKLVLIKRIPSFISGIFCFILYTLIILVFFIINYITAFLVYLKRKKLNLDPSKKTIDGVSFIIPTWNKKDMVTVCVQELSQLLSQEQVSIKKEIIVIDNGSNDHTITSLRSIISEIPIRIIHFKHNLGFAKAINYGVKKSQYNYIYLLNNDMIPQPSFFNNLITYAQKLIDNKQPFFGIASQIFFFDPNRRREESGKTYLKLEFGFLKVAHFVENINLEISSITAYLGGGSSLINKELFLRLGKFDHRIYSPLYCEDLDISINAWKKGYPCYFLPSSKIIHHHRSSSNFLPHTPDYYMNNNFLVFILKNIESPALIFNHLFFFPILIITNQKYCSYAWNALLKIPNIFRSRLKNQRFRNLIPDNQLFDFTHFEIKNFE